MRLQKSCLPALPADFLYNPAWHCSGNEGGREGNTLLGFTTIAGVSIEIAKFLAFLFLLAFLVLLVLGLLAGRRLTSP